MTAPVTLPRELVERASGLLRDYIHAAGGDEEHEVVSDALRQALTAAPSERREPTGDDDPTKALEDAEAYGMGFLLDGRRIDPTRMTVVRGPERREPTREEIADTMYRAFTPRYEEASDGGHCEPNPHDYLPVADEILALFQGDTQP